MNVSELRTISRSNNNEKTSRAIGNIYYPASVALEYGKITDAKALLVADETVSVMDSYGEKPYIVLDMGKSSVGGYVVICVSEVSKPVQFRVSFTNWFDHIIDETYGEIGDYTRGSCRYLGVELPILPADPNRYELFTISEPGEYFFPLLQGQLRWVRLQLDTEDAIIKLSRFRIENHGNFDTSEPIGYFNCDIDDYNNVWQAGVWTSQLASIPNNDAWVSLCGYLVPRYIETSAPIGYLECEQMESYTFSFSGRISINPSISSKLGFAFHIKDEINGIIGEISLEGHLNICSLIDGNVYSLFKVNELPVQIIDNKDFSVKIVANRTTAMIYINDILVCRLNDLPRQSGTVGFYTEKEMWFAVKDISLNSVLIDSDNLSRWHFCRTIGYLSDGAMRDRLLWTGDIAFASRNIYYAVNPQYIHSSIYMMMQNQTAEGYVNPSPYPGNKTIPKNDDYGPFPSSEFSAWFAPIVAEYTAYTGDLKTAADAYDAVYRNLEFVLRDIDKTDGLFVVVPELSKMIFSLSLGNGGKYSYTNVLVYLAFKSGAYLAKVLGKRRDYHYWTNLADNIKQAILSKLYDSERHTLTSKDGMSDFAPFSNSLAVIAGLIDDKSGDLLPLDSDEAGKLLGLSIRAMLKLNRDDEALNRIRNGSPNVNWIDAVNDWRHPATISECMHYPESSATGDNWNDKSHPDAAISDVFSAYVLGVLIEEIGFERYLIAPHFLDVTKAQGAVPTPYGDLKFSWEIKNNESLCWDAVLSAPIGTSGTLRIPITGSDFKVEINNIKIFPENDSSYIVECDNKFVFIRNINSGDHYIHSTSQGESYAEYYDKMKKICDVKKTNEKPQYNIKNVSSKTENSMLLWESELCDKNPWIELDLGEKRVVAGLRLFIAKDDEIRTPASFSVTVLNENQSDETTIEFDEILPTNSGIIDANLFTVLGLLKGRYIRINIRKWIGYSVKLSDIQIR